MSAMARKDITVIDGGRKGGGKGGGGTAPPADDDWKGSLTRTREGYVEGTLHNLILILERDERLAGLFWLNESSNQVLLNRDGPWQGGSRDEFTDADSCELAAWLQHPDRYYCRCKDDTVLKAVISVARRHRRHPIREYLSTLKWDGVPRVERMLVELFGAPDNAYSHRAAMCFMVGAVARILWVDPKQPFVGAQVDFMLVLEGEQGKRKSSAARALFSSQWFVETNESPTGKDFYQVIQGCWGVEIGEMDSFGKADVTAVKTAITRRVDKFRAPYERVPRTYRRECIFIGTTNEHEYLRDATGGRRFLPVRTDGTVELDRIIEVRDQLWAEAVALFDGGLEWWVLPAEAAEQQEERYIADSWEGRIDRWLSMAMPGDVEKSYPPRLRFGSQIDHTTTDEILQWCMGMDPGKHGRQEQMRVASAMKRLGWLSKRGGWDGVRERRWVRASGEQGGGADDPPPF